MFCFAADLLLPFVQQVQRKGKTTGVIKLSAVFHSTASFRVWLCLAHEIVEPNSIDTSKRATQLFVQRMISLKLITGPLLANTVTTKPTELASAASSPFSEFGGGLPSIATHIEPLALLASILQASFKASPEQIEST